MKFFPAPGLTKFQFQHRLVASANSAFHSIRLNFRSELPAQSPDRGAALARSQEQEFARDQTGTVSAFARPSFRRRLAAALFAPNTPTP